MRLHEKKGVLLFVGIGLILLSCLPLVPAEILVGQPASIYSGGDFLTTPISLIPSNARSDFAIVELTCEDQKLELYRSPFTLAAGEQAQIPFRVHLDPALIGDIEGICTLDVSYGPESAQSGSFTFSRALDVHISMNSDDFDPSSSLVVNGSARKQNGAALEGFVVITLENNTNVTSMVRGGTFNVSIVIPATTAAGTYGVGVFAYEKNAAGEILNSGERHSRIYIRQIPRSMTFAVSEQEIVPGMSFNYSVLLYDQTNIPIIAPVTVELVQPNGSVVRESIMAGNVQTVVLGSHALPGMWTLQATYGGISGKQEIKVIELENASFVLTNTTLVVTNTGNVPYQRRIGVLIGNAQEVFDLVLDEIGESKLFRLTAPDGEYFIKILEGNVSLPLGVSFLTGHATGVREISSRPGSAAIWGGWILATLVLLCIAFIAYRSLRQRAFKASLPMPAPHHRGLSTSAIPLLPTASARPLSSPTGNKEEVIVIALTAPPSEHTAATIERALHESKGSTARTIQGTTTLLFFPALMGEAARAHALRVLRVAQRMEEVLEAYNRTHGAKINWCIGVAQGSMIGRREGNKQVYTALGNTVVVATSASKQQARAIILSEELRRVLAGAVKGEKIASSFWKLQQIHRTHQNEFISRFTARHGADQHTTKHPRESRRL